MEIRARYILMGLFLIAAIGGVFAFIFWLENAGSLRDRTVYRITFDGPVSGLYSGSAVLFNGIRVGEVTALRIAADQPRQVAADIAVNTNTPIRQDTIVDLEYQGLTGVAAVSLTGGENGAPLVEAGDGIPMLEARHGAGLTVTQSARDALLKLHTILDDNSQPVKELIGNLNGFSGALARNSDKVDGILAGLERMTGGSRGPDTEKVYDLTAAPKSGAEPKTLRGQLAVQLPTAIFQLDTQNILFRETPDAAPLPPGARWADSLTRLLQMKIAQSFENAGYLDSVGHSDAITGEFQLLVDVRSFQMLTEPEPRSDIAFSAKIADVDGKILAAKLFEASAKAASAETEPSVTAMNEAFRQAAAELVTWAAGELEATGEPAADEKTQADPADMPTSDSAATDDTDPPADNAQDSAATPEASTSEADTSATQPSSQSATPEPNTAESNSSTPATGQSSTAAPGDSNDAAAATPPSADTAPSPQTPPAQ
ncbi:MAG: ABC-type transport auxiliary lipoprotein family protein [Rhodomicrobiaceae bacterium]